MESTTQLRQALAVELHRRFAVMRFAIDETDGVATHNRPEYREAIEGLCVVLLDLRHEAVRQLDALNVGQLQRTPQRVAERILTIAEIA